MNSVTPGSRRQRGQLTAAVREALRDLNVQLAVLNQRVSGQLELRGVDLQCLDLIDRHGQLGPSTLARLTGVHPATMTGVIDRLERGGWIRRERDAEDRRGVVLQPVRGRRADMLRLLAGMNAEMTRIMGSYSDGELEVIASFLRQTAEAGRTAAGELGD